MNVWFALLTMVCNNTGMAFTDYETAKQVAERLDIDPSQIRRYCEEGRIEGAFKPHPRMWLIPRGAMPSETGFGRPPSWSKD